MKVTGLSRVQSAGKVQQPSGGGRIFRRPAAVKAVTTPSLLAPTAMPFVRRRIAPDGSCLFASIDLLTAHADSDQQERADAPQLLRAHVAATVLAQPDLYTEALLGSPPDDYARWIQSPHNYGGENEITILAQLKQVEVCVVMLTNGTLLPYAPAHWLSDDASRDRVYIFFTGGDLGANHYDAIVEETTGSAGFPSMAVRARSRAYWRWPPPRRRDANSSYVLA
jgi:hypothetical protein